jgi:hypothetical protein
MDRSTPTWWNVPADEEGIAVTGNITVAELEEEEEAAAGCRSRALVRCDWCQQLLSFFYGDHSSLDTCQLVQESSAASQKSCSGMMQVDSSTVLFSQGMNLCHNQMVC